MSHAIRFGSNNSIGDKPCAVAKELIVHRHGIMRSPGMHPAHFSILSLVSFYFSPLSFLLSRA